MVFETEISEIREKTIAKNSFFFDYVFGSIVEGGGEGLGRVLGRFWEGFGGSWDLLGHFLASSFGACIRNALQKGSWGLLGSVLVRFSRV